MTTSLVRQLIERLDEAHDRIASLETKIAHMVTVGPVAERDHEKGIRLKIGGTDEAPMLGPWIQPPDISGTGRYLPDVGQQYMALAPGGDHEQAGLIPLTHSDQKPNPAADADTTVFYNRNGVSFSEKGGSVTLKGTKIVLQGSDGASAELTSEGWKHVGGYVKHDDHSIDKSHVHGGVQRGGAKTDPPD